MPAHSAQPLALAHQHTVPKLPIDMLESFLAAEMLLPLKRPCPRTSIARDAGDAKVLEGHAFVVEAAVSRGGRDLKPGINVYRFANRIPLLFEVRHCAS